MKLSAFSFFKRLSITLTALVFSVSFAYGATDVTIQWDANQPSPEGYRVFAREAGQSYDYEHPIWEKNLTSCTLTGLVEGVTYYFVVRAFDGSMESVDSDEVSYTPPLVNTGAGTGTSTDNGGITDTDGDGLPDTSTNNDSSTDTDGDGVPDAIDSYPNDPHAWTDADNNAPDAPVIDTAVEDDVVGLTPVLICGAYFDTDNDDHYRSRWQISTESDFSTLILDEITENQLTTYTIGEMVLDVDTVYYWRVRFIDARNGASDWSASATFTTIAAEDSDDVDMNGIPDAQEVDETVDVNENGLPDSVENTIMSVNTVEGQVIVGVEADSDLVTLVSMKSLSTEAIPDKSVKLVFGLVGFKLYLQEGIKTATVKLHFSEQVPENAKLFKYSIDRGWEAYENAAFSANRKSVSLVLEDGGMGDEDGVENGVIVDPSGIAWEYPETTSNAAAISTGDVSTGGSGGSGCFITSSMQGSSIVNVIPPSALAMMILLGLAIVSGAVWQALKRR